MFATGSGGPIGPFSREKKFHWRLPLNLCIILNIHVEVVIYKFVCHLLAVKLACIFIKFFGVDKSVNPVIIIIREAFKTQISKFPK